jgi:CRISPR-associated protein Cas5t
MEFYKIEITSWTASFRYPNLISGFQPTLEVPPISTVLGLINAAAGNYQKYDQLKIGYYFEYEAKCVDLETIYQMDGKNGTTSNQAKSNVIRREFLYNNLLNIYLTDENIVDFFTNPVYPIVLGRMNDLATVKIFKDKVKLEEIKNPGKIQGQIIPFFPYQLSGQLQALPKYFTDTFPRKNIGTEPYSIINFNSNDNSSVKSNITAYRDEVHDNKLVDIFIHQLNF